MLEDNKEKENMCLLYVNNYHFEMICLPYIRKCLKENKKVKILTQENLENEVSKILTIMKLNNEEENEILNLDWKEKTELNIETLKDEGIIFVKGKENYIENLDKKLEKFKNIQIIDCYNLEDMNSNNIGIISKYTKILSTNGIEAISAN